MTYSPELKSLIDCLKASISPDLHEFTDKILIAVYQEGKLKGIKAGIDKLEGKIDEKV